MYAVLFVVMVVALVIEERKHRIFYALATGSIEVCVPVSQEIIITVIP